MSDRNKTVLAPIPNLGHAPPPPATNRAKARRRRQMMLAAVAVGLAVVFIGLVASISHFKADAAFVDANELGRFTAHDGGIRCLDVSMQGDLVVSGDDHGVALAWDQRTRQPVGTLTGHHGPVNCASIASDGATAATGGDDGTLRLWDLKKFSETRSLDAHRGGVTHATFYPAQTHVLTAGRDHRIVLWDIARNEPRKQYTVEAPLLTCLAISPDGLWFTWGDANGAVHLAHVATGQEVARLSGHAGAVRAIAFAPMSDRAISYGDDGTMRLWNVETQTQAAQWSASSSEVTPTAVAFSPGGTRVISTDAAGIVQLWSSGGERVSTFNDRGAGMTCAAFVRSGLAAMTGSADQTVRVWRLPDPTAREIKEMEAVAERFERQVAVVRKFARQVELAQQFANEKKAAEAIAEFRAAELLVSPISLEYQLAHGALLKLSDTKRRAEAYEAYCKAGRKAAENEDYAEAVQQFQLAQESIEGCPELQNQTDAATALDECAKALSVSNALASAKVVKRDLNFQDPLEPPASLVHVKDVAFLLASSEVPMASATNPLAWKIDLDTDEPMPKADVALRIELVDKSSDEIIATVSHPFEADTKEQHFEGKAPAPAGGWKPGEYVMRSFVTHGERSKPFNEPETFKIGVMHWHEHVIELTPALVLDHRFTFTTDVKVARGDGLMMAVDGMIAPAPLNFYRELLADPKIARPVPASAEGLRWSNDGVLKKYRVVDVKSNFAALLVRIGHESPWMAYREKVPVIPAPLAGTIELSINSVMPAVQAAGITPREITNNDRAYWAADCGAYTVTIRQGTFDFPDSLSFPERAGILLRFKK